jgi:hypothetical protein
LVTEPTTGKRQIALNFRSPNDGVAFSVTGDLDLLEFGCSFRVDVQSVTGVFDSLGGSCKRVPLDLSLKISPAELDNSSPHEMAFHLIQLITRLANRKGDQVIGVDFSSPEAQAILNLDGGRFGKLLLGFLYMLANQHSQSDPDGAEHYLIRIQGRKHLRGLSLAFREWTVHQVTLSIRFVVKISSAAVHPLPVKGGRDTLHTEPLYGPDGHTRTDPHPPHSRGRALRATA